MAFEAKKTERIAIQENSNFKKMYGIGEFRVLAVNPTKKELNKIYAKENSSEDVEIEYAGVNENGNKYTRINFILETIGADNGIRSLNFFLEDSDRKNNEGNKYQFLNLQGKTSWAEEESKLPAWFTKKQNGSSIEVKKAKIGEADLYTFLRCWLSQHDWYNNTGFFEIKNILKGNVKEISENINSEIADTILANVVIISKVTENAEGSAERKFFETIYNKDFLPGKLLNELKLIDFTFPIEIDVSEKYSTKFIKKFLTQFNPKNEYPVKGIVTIELLKDFNENEHLISSEDTMREENENFLEY